MSLIRDTVVDFGADVISVTPFLSASHSFVATIVFIEGTLPTRQTGGDGSQSKHNLVNNFSSFLEHLLHDEHFSGDDSPVKSVGASAGDINLSIKPQSSICLLATGYPLQECLDVLDTSEHVGAR